MRLRIGSRKGKKLGKAILVLRRKDDESICFPLSKFPVVLGREPTNDIVLDDYRVSRKHARIILSAGQIVIEDLSSANGTFVNGVRISSSMLTEGDELRLGSWVFLATKGSGDRIATAESSSPLIATTQSISPDELDAEIGDRTQYAPVASVAKVLGFFQQAGKILESAFELDDVLKRILDLTFQMIPAERGFILLTDADTGAMTIRAQKFRDLEENPPSGEAELSKTILEYATTQGRAVLTSDAAHDDRFGAARSVIAQEIRGAICVPLKGRQDILGAIYADSKLMSHKFSLDDLKLLTSVGAQLGIAVENARLYESKLRTERLTAVGQAVAELGHCVKNILNGMEGGSFILEKGLDKDDKTTIRNGWDVLKRNNSRLRDLVLDMLDYSKPREPAWELVSANRVLWDLVELLKEKAAAKGVELMFEPDETFGEVMIDSKAIYRAILNLLTNAVDACPSQAGKVLLKTLLLPGGKSYQIIVSDNGSGIAPENLVKLGRTFFSTKGSQGTGLGLSVAYKIIAEHRGNIFVDSQVGKGTTFKITLQVQRPDSK